MTIARVRNVLVLLVVLITVGCSGSSGGEPEATPEPRSILRESAQLIQQTETFGLEVVQYGAPFKFLIDLGRGTMEVGFNRAIGQYVAPNEIQATISVDAQVPIDVEVYANGNEQWYRAPLIGWVQDDFATEFSPRKLIAEGSGFEAALSALEELTYVGRASINGIGTYHLSGMAQGPDLTDVLLGLIEMQGRVPVDVYINRESGYPVRVRIEQPGTATEDLPNTSWEIDVFDINEEPDIKRPTPEGS